MHLFKAEISKTQWYLINQIYRPKVINHISDYDFGDIRTWEGINNEEKFTVEEFMHHDRENKWVFTGNKSILTELQVN